MLNLTVEIQGTKTIVHLEGQVDETFSLEKEMPVLRETLELNCAKINRMNSTGVKKWMIFLNSISKQTKIRFVSVSPAMVEQFNLISNFGSNGEVVSVLLPYECVKCGNTFSIVKTVPELLKAKLQISPEKCPKCGDDHSEFDDLPEEYLQFLN